MNAWLNSHPLLIQVEILRTSLGFSRLMLQGAEPRDHYYWQRHCQLLRMMLYQREKKAGLRVPMNTKFSREHRTARYMHAVYLRQEKLTWKQIGVHLGVCTERARQICLKGERIMRHPEFWAVQHDTQASI